MRLGIRLSIYDDHDNELHAETAWLPTSIVDLTEWRGAYDAICAALWSAVGRLVEHQQRRAGVAE